MATTSFTALRGLARFAFTLTLFCLCLTGAAAGQGSPLVSASVTAGLNHPTGWSTILQTAIDANGNWLVEEYPHGGLFEFPANSGLSCSASGGSSCMVTLVPLGGVGGGPGSDSYWSGSFFLDPAQNLYLGGAYSNCLLMFPYGSAANPWPLLASTLGPNASAPPAGVAKNTAADFCSLSAAVPPNFAEGGPYVDFASSPGYFEPWAAAAGAGYWANSLLIGTVNSGYFIFSMPVAGAWANPVADCSSCANTLPPTEIIGGLTTRPISIAVDPEGNIYFTEDWTNGAGSYAEGVFEIPAGSTGLKGETGLTRADPNLPNVTGVITDAAGNLYISDGTEGVFEVPNPSGTPQTSSAFQVSTVPAQGEVAIDWQRDILYVPTTQTQSNGQADVSKVNLGFADLGSSPLMTATASSVPVSYTFNGSVTPASFSILEDGALSADFAITGGTCTTGTAYAAGSSCSESITMTPHSVGSISAKLLMLDQNKNVLAAMLLHGIGTGALMQAGPALESNIGATGSLTTPSQVALDGQGKVYVADAGKGEVLVYAAGSGASATATTVGKGLTAPTGVAVDGVGDVFIADSGNVYEVPFTTSGLTASAQITLVSGLGNNLRLAADGHGNLYVADPSNQRVVKLSNLGQIGPTIVAQSETYLTAGFNAPSAVAVDSNNNLDVIDGSNLLQVAGGVGAPSTLLSTLSGATALAVDPSGAVYIAGSGGTQRIPDIGGTLAQGNATALAVSVSNPTSVALDKWGNVYLTDGTAEDVHLVSTTGTLTFTPFTAANQSATLDATIVNAGNSSLTVTGYSATNPTIDSVPVTDFTAADGSCEASSPVAAGASCEVAVTLNPGPGEQGALSSQVSLTSNSANSPLIDASGTAFSLAGANLSVAIGSTAQAINTPVTVTVSPQSGSAPPSGEVAVTFTSWVAQLPTSCPANQTCGAEPSPVTETVTATLNGSGIAGLVLAPIMAGTQTITVEYIGDRNYGRATTTVNATIAKSSIASMNLDPNPPPYLPFVLEQDGSTSYDGTQTYWQYSLPVTIHTAAGIPTGTITFMDNSSTCPPGTSATGQGAATCALISYSGVACPQSTDVAASSGNGIQFIANSGANSSSASTSFATSCLPMLQNTTYTPVISTHYITPVYSGDANFTAFTGTAPQLYQVLRSPEVVITSSPTTLSVSPGSMASTTLTLTSLLGYGYSGKGATLNDYNFPVTLSCDNLPPHTECTFSYPTTVNPDQPTAPNSVQIPCSGTTSAADNCLSGVVTMTINTNVAEGTTTSRNAAVASVTLASIFGMGMVGLFLRRRRFLENYRWLLMVVLMVVSGALAVTLSACSTTNLTPQAQLSTPAGTYAVTVTAQQVGSQTVTSSGSTLQVYGSETQVSVPFFVNVTVQ